MFDRDRSPWKGLGKDVSYAEELKEVLEIGGLNFTVAKAPVLYDSQHHDGSRSDINEVDGSYVTYRTDTGMAFGIVGSKYEIVQNYDAFKFIEMLFAEANIHYVAAGTMEGGSKMFVVVQLPDSITIGPDDHVNKYLIFTTTHDGTGSVIVVITGVRIRCGNAIQAAIRGASSKFSMKHTKNVQVKIDYVQQLIKAQEKYFIELGEMLNTLREIELTKSQIDQSIAFVFLPKDEYDQYMVERYNLYDNTVLSTKRINILVEIRDSLDTAPGQDMYTGTALWVYNGITSYLQNVKEFKSADDRFTSILDDKYGSKLDHILETFLLIKQ
jgi:phage/plasmid-like protein (TIGR03299 family)